MNRFWLEGVCLFKILFITVVELMAVNAIWVFESLRVNVDIFLSIASDGHHI